MNDVKSLDINNLKYFVVPVERRGSCAHIYTHDLIFDFWQKSWEKAFNDTGVPKKGWEDHFTRQNLVTAITHNNDIIACVLFTFYDVSSLSAQHSEYFSYISQESISYMLRNKIKDAMSVEYLITNPNYKKNSLGVSLGKLIVSLSAYVAEDQGMDCIVGMPISTTKVNLMLDNVGASTIQPNIKKYGYTLNLMMSETRPAFKGKDRSVKRITDILWENRTDYTRSDRKKINDKVA